MGRKQKDETNEVLDMSIPSINIKCKNPKQKEFINTIDENQITICSGPAGTGKSYLSIAKALQLIKKPDNPYHKLIIVNPAVEADEKLGFLKGTLQEKLAPYTFSSIDLVDKVIGKANRRALQQENAIEVVALAFMRGWNCDNAILVMEESQNMTISQMKTLLTRIGTGTKYIISGDMEQSDRYKDTKRTGLFDAINRLKGMNDIGVVEFELEDVVRNPIIAQILAKYEEPKEPAFNISTKVRPSSDQVPTKLTTKKKKPTWQRKLKIWFKKQWYNF